MPTQCSANSCSMLEGGGNGSCACCSSCSTGMTSSFGSVSTRHVRRPISARAMNIFVFCALLFGKIDYLCKQIFAFCVETKIIIIASQYE